MTRTKPFRSFLCSVFIETDERERERDREIERERGYGAFHSEKERQGEE